MKRLLLAFALAAFLGDFARAATPAIQGAPLAISAATSATPIVLTTAANTLQANDWVLVTGVQGIAEANGIWQCSAVDATHCTLSGSVGVNAYTQGGMVTPLGVVAATVGSWFDIGKCDKAYVFVWAPAGAVANVNIEASSQATNAAPKTGPTTPAFVLTTIANPTATGAYYSIPVMSNVRVNVTAWTSGGSVYATLEGYRAGSRVY
jgi:hypothetical protein